MSFLDSLRAPSVPSVAVEIAGHRVSAAAIDHRGGRPIVSAHATESIPAGAVVPALATRNIADRAAVVGALSRVLDRLGSRPTRVGLVIPDLVARVSLVRFEQVPARTQDLDQLIRWQVKKAAPFPIEDAQVTYIPGWHAPDGQEFIAAVARRDIIEEYESICGEAGAHAGLVDLSTFNVANAVLAAGLPQTDWLLVNVAPEYASIAILRRADLIFFRNRASSDEESTLADLVHQTAMYYEDRLKGGGFSRVVLAGAGGPGDVAEIDTLRRSLEDRLGAPVELVDPRNAATIGDRIAASASLLDTLAPLVGMLLRGREVMA